VPKLTQSLKNTKPTTVGLFGLVTLWALFQWRDPTPPPVLDQILVATFGVWFANEAIDRKNNGTPRRTVIQNADGTITVTEDEDEDDEPEENHKKGGR
jgi:hypothetical protein